VLDYEANHQHTVLGFSEHLAEYNTVSRVEQQCRVLVCEPRGEQRGQFNRRRLSNCRRGIADHERRGCFDQTPST